MDRLRVGLGWCRCPIGNVDMGKEWPHDVHADEAGWRFQTHNYYKAGPYVSLAPLEVQMLSFSSNLEWFAVSTVYYPLKLPRGSPLSAIAPPNVEPHARHGCSSVHQPKDGDAFQGQLAGDGWTDPTPNLGHHGLRWPFQQSSRCGLVEVLEGWAFGGGVPFFSTEEALWSWLTPWSALCTLSGVLVGVASGGRRRNGSGRRQLNGCVSGGRGRRMSNLSSDIFKAFLQEPDLLLHLKLFFRIRLLCQDFFYSSDCGDHTFHCVVPQFSYLCSQRSLQYIQECVHSLPFSGFLIIRVQSSGEFLNLDSELLNFLEAFFIIFESCPGLVFH